MHQKNAQNLTLKPQMMNAKASRLTSIALSACVILTAHWGQSIFEVKFLQFVCLFVTEATQYCVLKGQLISKCLFGVFNSSKKRT